MSRQKPFKRTSRQFIDGSYGKGENAMYVLHPKFAVDSEHYMRAFLMIQKDLFELFDYVEPSNASIWCYSYRIHALFMRVCIEIEANFTAILSENGYLKSDGLDLKDYRKIELSHRLSDYEVLLPSWKGSKGSRRPFIDWKNGYSLPWYKAYTEAKHNRHEGFSQANFDNLIEAVCGLVALLSSQFHIWDFSAPRFYLAQQDMPGSLQGFKCALGGYFYVKFPSDWPESERYDFDWRELQSDPNPFQTLFP